MKPFHCSTWNEIANGNVLQYVFFSKEIYHERVKQAVVVFNPLFILEIRHKHSAQVTLSLRMYFNRNHSYKIHLSKLISSLG